jgi:anti-anti-sigma factor
MRFPYWLCLPFLPLAGVVRRARFSFLPRTHPGTPGPVSPRGPAGKRPEPALRLEIEVLDSKEGVVVRLRGEAGIAEAGALETALLRLAARRPAGVTFDLSELLFLSSLATGVLEAYRHAAVRAGVRVRLAPGLHPAVREALTRAGLIDRFEAAPGARPCAEGSQAPCPKAHEVERTYGLTWFQLIELEPQVEALLWRARLAGAKWRPFMPVEQIFGPVRDELAGLIGFAGKYRKHPVLGSVGAYEVAYWKLYDAVAGSLPGGPTEAPEAQGGPEV